MACEVKKEDIIKEVKNKLLGVENLKLSPYKNTLIEKYTKDHTSGPTKLLSETLKDLREEYNVNKWGPLYKGYPSEYGYVIELTPTQELADAMTSRVFMQEEIENGTFSQIEDAKRAGQEYNDRYLFDSRYNEVNYSLKSVEILSSDKAKQVFEKGKKNNWDLNKILTELQIPKEQKQIILDKNITDREEIITSLLVDNSFVVEVNVAQNKGKQRETELHFIYNEEANLYSVFDDVIGGYREFPTAELAQEFIDNQTKENINSTYYEGLTVPGGTNYTENEIATPAITPSIKGHAQFSTDNGIGWFRSDDKTFIHKQELEGISAEDYWNLPEEERKIAAKKANDNQDRTKTRRILELQSDLFQKGRNMSYLDGWSSNDFVWNQPYVTTFFDYTENGINYSITRGHDKDFSIEDDKGNTRIVSGQEVIKLVDKYKRSNISKNKNQFLQLLNKNNNWVTFFVKSIIQDSAKKGYEKVLFPKGDTAAKIEGHQTLEEFKKQKEARIKELEEKINKPITIEKMPNGFTIFRGGTQNLGTYSTLTAAEEIANNKLFTDLETKEINQLKQEIADVESGKTQLSSIANFYETIVTNILKKQGYNPVEITDGYGNTWNEVEITPEVKNETIFLSRYSDNTQQQTENTQKPVGDNYNDLVAWKLEERDNVQKQISILRYNLQNETISSKEGKAKLRNLENHLNKINNQLDNLRENREEFMYHSIIEDLENIENSIKSIDTANTEEIRKTLDFYKEFQHTLSFEDNSELYKKITSDITRLSNLIDKLVIEKTKEALNEHDLINNTLENLNEGLDTRNLSEEAKQARLNLGVDENYEITLEDLLKTKGDIGWLDQMFLGINTSTAGDSIIPQILYSEFSREMNKHHQVAAKIISKFNAFDIKHPNVDKERLKEKDKDGKETGFIIDIFSSKWFKAKRVLSNFIRSIETAENFEEQRNNYINTTQWIQENAEILNPMKLSVVKDLYKDIPYYKDYFIYSDKTIKEYEDLMKKQLGPRYQDTINSLLDKLAAFEEYRTEEINDSYYNRNLAKNNIWEFIKKFQENDTSAITYSYVNEENKNITSSVFFTGFKDLGLVPKSKVQKVVPTEAGFQVQTVSTEYYNNEFQNIKNDPILLELWGIYKEAAEYIDNSYNSNNLGRISFPKFKTEMGERMLNNIKYIKSGKTGKFKDLFKDFVGEYKEMFYEKGRQEDERKGITSNASDRSNSDINKLAKTIMLREGLSYDEAIDKATNKLLPTYSKNIDKNFKAALLEASLNNARIATEPLANGLLHTYKSLDPEREKGIKRLTHYIDKILLNKTSNTSKDGQWAKDRGKEGGLLYNILKFINKIPVIKTFVGNVNAKLFSEQDKIFLEELKALQQSGYNNNKSFKIDKKVGNKEFYLQTKKEIIEGEREPIKRYFISKPDVEGNQEEVSKAEFDKLFQEYIAAEIENTGLIFNLAGIVDGIMKTVIIKGMGLAPVSGIFNRIEGMHTIMIMDATGEYWGVGNADIAKEFMAFANIKNIKDRFKNNNFKNKEKQLEIFRQVIKNLDVIQNRKNELQKSVSESKVFNSEFFNIFKMSIDNPEFKNQGTIALSVMMDSMVEINGKKVPFFNKQTQEFTLFTLENGQVSLKPQYRNLNLEAILSSKETGNMVDKITNAISHSQGNYNTHDIMMAKANIWGRIATQFKTWVPSQLEQRFAVRSRDGELNINLQQGKLKREGRFIEGYKASKGSSIAALLGVLGISYGALGMVGLVGGGLGAAFVFNKYLKNLSSKTKQRQDANTALEIVEFIKSVLIESFNYPSRVASSIPGVKHVRINTNKDNFFNAYRNSGMTDKEINSLKAMSRELAIILNLLLAKVLLGALTYDEDDDEDSPERMRYNFIQNQLTKAITTLAIYTEPTAYLDDMSRMSALKFVSDLGKFLKVSFIDRDMEETSKSLLDLTPMPRIITEGVEGKLPWEQSYNTDINPLIGNGRFKYLHDFTRDRATDGEFSAKKELSKMREERKEELEKIYLKQYPNKDKEELEKIINKQLYKEIPTKNKKKQGRKTYKEILNNIEK